MKKEYLLERLDLKALAQAGDTLSGRAPLLSFARLAEESLPGEVQGREVVFEARGELRPVSGGPDQVWLHLEAEARLVQVCQRCLGPVEVLLSTQRAFRFVRDEAVAEAEDEGSEEDVLVFSRDFNLHELIEDELLMELPVVPRHEVCPEAVTLAVEDDDFQASQEARPNPFAALAALKKE